MSGVGKLGLAVFVLLLCLPAAGRLSGNPGYAQFNLPAWLLKVCHHRLPARGTQQQNSRRHEPLNVLLEEWNKTDVPANALRSTFLFQPASAARESSSFVPHDRDYRVADPAFLCTFRI